MSKPTHNQAVKKLIEKQEEQLSDLQKQLDKAFNSQKPDLLKKISEKEQKIVSLGGKIIRKVMQAPGFDPKSHYLTTHKPFAGGYYAGRTTRYARKTRRSRQRKTRRKC